MPVPAVPHVIYTRIMFPADGAATAQLRTCAHQLIEAHEDATREGYHMQAYPAERIDGLARNLLAALGRPLPQGIRPSRAHALYLARAALHEQRPTSSEIFVIEVLATHPSQSYCGAWMTDTTITGPSGDSQQEMTERAQELQTHGHVVRVVAETHHRRTVWTGTLP